MAAKGSRYDSAPFFAGQDGQLAPFGGVRARAIGPATGVLEYTVKEGDRLDLLALYFYNDSRKWWRILDANPEIMFGGELTLAENVGMTLQIPRAIETGARR